MIVRIALNDTKGIPVTDIRIAGHSAISVLAPPARAPQRTSEMLELRGVTKHYGAFPAVKGIDLKVHRGEIFGFLGPNGAGKTTTIRIAAGVLRPTAGTVLIGGDDLERAAASAKSRVGYIPDRPFLYEKRSVRASTARLLELFQLAPWKDELIETYSHGMRQKLLISSALIHQPELIVVDEPMVGLDPRSARLLKDLFRTFAGHGGTVFLSTHTLEVVEALCDRIAIIAEGEIIALGSMDELRAQAHAGGAHLEEIFLKVTGGEAMADVIEGLREAIEQ
jgi:ABC-2 type transport system ATP-binding protein